MFPIATVVLVVVAPPAAVRAVQRRAWAVLAVVVAMAVVALTALNLIGTALSAVFPAADFRIAARGAGDGAFSAGLVQGPFTPR